MKEHMRVFSNIIAVNIILLVCVYLTNTLIIREDIVLSSYLDVLEYGKAEQLTSNLLKYRWVGYVLLPIVLLLKWLLVSLCIYIALFLLDIKAEFKRLWMVAVKAEWVFVIVALIKFLWFLLIQTDFTLEEYQFFYPLSVLNLFEPNTLEAWWLYPFQLLNAFELAYWLVLAYLLAKELKFSFNEGLEVVIKGYGSGLLIWVLLVFFITLNFSV